jgi:hypothetical protein
MKPLSGKKVLFVICQENFRDEELATANGPPAARDFGRALVSAISKG